MLNHPVWRRISLFLLALCVACAVNRSDSLQPVGLAQWSLTPNTLTTDGNTVGIVSLLALDAAARPWAHALVQWSAPAGLELIAVPQRTDVLGMGTAGVRCAQPGLFELTAAIGDGACWSPLKGGLQVSCLAPEASAQPAPAPTPDPPKLVFNDLHPVGAADIGAPTLVTLMVTDAQGRPLANQTVVLTTQRPGDHIMPATAVTDAQGRVQVSLTATALGTATVIAQSGGVSATATVNFVAGAPNLARSTFVAHAAPAVADGVQLSLLDLQVRDNNGHGVPYASVTFASSLKDDVVNPSAALTDANGLLTVDLSGTRAGLRTVTASTHVGDLNANTTLIAGPADAAHSMLMLSPNTTTADGVSPSYLTVVAQDAFGNPLANVPCVLSSSSPGDLFDPASSSTGSDGVLRSVVVGSTAGLRTLSANCAALHLAAGLTLVPGAPSTALSSLQASPTSQGVGAPIAVMVRVVDNHNNPVTGARVSFAGSGSSGSDTMTPPFALTDNLGVASSQLTGTVAGSHSIIASLGSAGTSLSSQVTLTPGSVSVSRSLLLPGSTVATANGNATIALTLLAVDAYGNAIPGATVALSADGAQNSFASATGVTDASGRFVSSLTSTLAQSEQVMAAINGQSVSPVAVRFVAGAIHAQASALTVTGSGAVANGQDAVSLQVTLRDAFGNPEANQTVALALDTQTSGRLTPASGVTDGQGQFMAVLQSTQATSKVITARAGSVTLSNTATFVAGPPSATTSTLSSAPSAIIADGASQSTLWGTLMDAYGNVVTGYPVTWSFVGAGGNVVAGAGASDGAGFVSATAVGVVAGPAQVVLHAGSMALSQSITLLPGPPSASASQWVVSPNHVVADGTPMAVTLRLRDGHNNAVPDAAVTLTVDHGHISAANGRATTDGQGVVATSWSGTVAGPSTFTAQAGNITLTAFATFVAGPVVQPGSSLNVQGGTVTADGVSPVTVTVTLVDAFGNAAQGAPVQLTSSVGSDTLAAVSAATDGNGQVQAAVRATAAGGRTLTATSGGTTLTAGAYFVPGPAVSGQSALTISPNATVADGAMQATLQWQLRDAFGNPAPFAPVAFTTGDGGITITGASATSDAAGIAQAQITGTATGAKTLHGQAGASAQGNVVLQLLPGPPSPSQSTWAASGAQVADGATPITLTLTLRDAFNNPEPGVAVTLAASGPGSLGATTGLTDVNGLFVTTMTSTLVSSQQIAATLGSATLVTTATFVPGPPDVATSTLFISPNVLPADGTTSAALLVLAADAYGNPVPNLNIAFASSDSTDTLTAAASTDVNGTAQSTLTSTVQGQKVLTVQLGAGPSLSGNFTVVPVNAASDTVHLTLSPNVFVADGNVQCVVTFAARDINGNPLVGQAANVVVFPVSAQLGAAQIVLDGQGQGTTTLATTALGSLTVQATIDNVTTSAQARAVAGSPNGTLSAFTVSSASTVADGVSQALLQVQLQDDLGHPVSGVNVALTGDGASTLGSATLTSNSLGQASTGISSTVAGAHGLIAQVGPLSLSANAQFVPGAIDAGTSIATLNPNTAVADGAQAMTLTVRLADARNNAIANQALTVSAQDSNVIVAPLSSSTNGAGAATLLLRSTHAAPLALTVSAQRAALAVAGAFVAGTPNQVQSSLTVSPNTLVADGVSTAAAQILIRDALGNGVGPTAVTCSSSGPGVTITPSSGVTDTTGALTVNISATYAGTTTLRAAGGGLTLSAPMVLTAGSASASTSTITLTPTAVVADGSAQATVTVVARDSYGNLAAGQRVVSGVPNSSIVFGGPGATDGNGVWQGTATSLVAQSAPLTVSLGAVTLSAPAQFIAGPPSAATSTVTASSQSTVANGQSTVNLTVQALDGAGNPVANQNVSLAIGGAGNTAGTLTGVTDASGVFRTTLVSTRAEAKALSAQVAGITLLGSVTFVAGAPASAMSSVLASPNTLVADGQATATVTVAVIDVFGNPVAHQAVSIASMPSGYALGASSGTTGIGGTWSTTLTGTQSGSPSLTAVFAGASATGTVLFVAGPPSPQTSTFVASAPQYAADGNSQLSLYLQLADAFNNPVTHASAQFSSTIASDVLTPPTGVTSSLGGVGATLVSSTTGAHTLTAQSGALTLQTVVTAGPGLPDAGQSTLAFNPNSVTADGVSVAALTVFAADRLGHAVPSQAVSLSASGSAVAFGAATGVTDGTGRFTTTVASTVAELKTVTANLGSTAISAPITFVAGPMNSNASQLLASPSTVTADGAQRTTLQLTAKDAQQNLVLGHAVSFSVSGGNNVLTPGAATTSATGTAQATLQSIQAENKTAVARVDNTAVSTPVAFVAGAANVQATHLQASPNQLLANGAQSTVTLALADAQGNPLQNQAVTVVASGSSNVLSATSGTTDGLGTFSVTLSSTVAESKTVQMSAGGVSVSVPVTFQAGPPVAATSLLNVSPNSVVADGNSVAQLRLTLNDAYGNITPGVAATVSASGSSNRLPTSGATSDATGTALWTLGSTVAESKTVTASFAGTSLTASVLFVAGPVSNAASVLTANPNSIAADGVSQSTVVVVLADAQGNPVTNTQLTFGTSGSDSTFAPPQATTDATGRASTTLTGTQAGTKLLTASTTTTTVSGALTLTPGPPNNAHSTFTVSPNIILADGQSSATLGVIVRDAFDNLLVASPVALSASGAGVTFTPASGLTDGAGAWVGQVAATTAEAKTLSAALLGTSLSQHMVFVPGPVNPNQSSLTVTPSTAVADGQTPITLTLTLRDAFANLITGQSATLSSSSATTVFDRTQGASDGNGILSAQMVSTKAQAVTLTANAGGTTINAQALFVPGASTNQSIALTAQPSYQSADANAAIVLSLLVADTSGNPIAGQAANFISSNAADSIAVVPPGVTGADGRLLANLYATQAGSRTLTASFAALSTTAQATIAAGVPNSGQSSAVISPNQVVADGSSQGTLVITVRDTFGNLVPNQSVSVALTSGDAGRTTVTPATGYDDVSGVFPVNVSSTVAEAKMFIATIGAAQVSAQAWFVPGPVSPQTSTLTASPPSVLIDGNTPTVITLRLLDVQGNVEPNQPVSLSVSGGNNVLSPQSGVTDGNGLFVASLASTRAETKSLIATTSITSITGSVTFVPGSPNSITSSLTAAPALLVADNVTQATLTAIARDRYGNVVPSVPAVFSGGGATVFTALNVTTDASGQAVTQVRSTLAQMATLQANLGTATVTIPVTWTAGAPVMARSTLTLSPNVLMIDGTTQALATAMFADAYGNPTLGQNVVFAVPAPYSVSPANALTNSSGTASAAVSGTLAGTLSVTAQASGVTLSAPLTWLPGAPAANTSMLTLSPNVQVADGTSPMAVAATFKDSFGNAIFGKTVTFAGFGARELPQSLQNTTNGSGLAATTVASTLAHGLQVTAQLANVVLSGNATFVAGSPNQFYSQLSVSPNTLVADTIAASTISVVLADAYNNLVPNQNIVVAVSGGNNTLGQAALTTSAAGAAATTLQSSRAETKAVTATAQGVSLSQNVIFLPGSPNGTMSTFIASPSSQIADGNQFIALTLTLKDAFGNVVPAIAGAFASQQGNATVVPPTGSTNARGQLVSSATSLTVGNPQLTAQAGAVALAANVTFTVGPPAASTSMLVASPNTGLISNNAASLASLSLTAKDAQGRALSGLPVVFYGPDKASLIGTRRAVTDSNGFATSTLGGLVAGPRGAYAKVGGVLLSTSATFAPNGTGGADTWFGRRPLALLTTGSTNSTTAADMDGDGKLDLVMATAGGNAVSVFRNLGLGAFSAATTYTVPGAPQHHVTADINKDGRQDLVVASNTNAVYVLLNTGTAPGAAQGYAVSGNVVALCLGDINNDGNQDVIAVSAQGPAGFTPLLGNGAGALTAAPFVSMGTGAPTRCATADFNKDGYLDVAVTNGNTTTVDVYFGAGNGNFTLASKNTVNAGPLDVAVAKLNADSYWDLVVSDANSAQVSVLLGTSGGNFLAQTTLTTDVNPSGLQLTDLDQDGNIDILVATGYPKGVNGNAAKNYGVNYFLGAGDGTFASKRLSATGSAVNAFAVADFDGDGTLDIGFGYNAAPSGSVLFGAYDKLLPDFVQNNASGFSTLTLGDFDGDGVIDAVSSEFGYQRFYHSVGQNRGAYPGLNGPFNVRSPMANGDFDGDGHLDVVKLYNFNSATGYVGLGHGDGTFSWTTLTVSSAPQGNADGTLCSGDLDSNGLDDVVFVGNTSAQLTVALASGNANTFTNSFVNLPAGQASCGRCALRDVNRDGKLDVVLPCKNLVVYLGQGDGTLAAPVVYTQTGTTQPLQDIAVADFNEDGYADVAAATASQGYVLIFLNDQNGAFLSNSVVPATMTLPSYFVASGDFNGDGHADLAAGQTGSVNILYGSGTGTFPQSRSFGAGVVAEIAVADLNQDGLSDIVASVADGPLVWLSSYRLAATGANPNAVLSSFVATPQTLTANNSATSTLTLRAVDDLNHVIPGAAVTLALASGQPGGTTVWPYAATLAPQGGYAAQVRASRAELKTVTATVNGYTQAANVLFVPGSLSSAASTMAVNPNTVVADGVTPASITVTVTDAFSNPLSGLGITLATAGGNIVFNPGSGSSDSNGQLQSAVTSMQAQMVGLTATVGGITLAGNVVFVAGSPNAVRSTLSLSPNTITADNVSSATLVATFKDAFNNPLVGQTVFWGGNGAQDTFGASQSLTNGAGAATTTLKSTLAHVIAVQAQQGNLLLNGNITAVPGPPSAVTSSLLTNPNTVTADGTSAITLTALVNDAYNNPVPSFPVSFSGPGGNVIIQNSSGTTSMGGIYSGTVTSTYATIANITMTAVPIVLTKPVQFLAGSVVWANSSITGTHTAAADGNAPITAAVQLYDAYYNPVPNVSVSVASTGNQVIISPAAASTNAAGQVTSLLTSTIIQSFTYNVVCQTQNVTFNGNFSYGAPSATTSTFVANPNAGLASDGNTLSTLTLTVRDSLSRLVPGVQVAFNKPGYSGRLSTKFATTNSQGQVTSTLSSLYAGTQYATALMGPTHMATQVGFSSKAKYCATQSIMGNIQDTYPNAGGNVFKVVPVDLNHDGKTDWVQASAIGTGQIQVFLNQGNQTFASNMTAAFSAPPTDMVVVDLNKDTYPEILVMNGNLIIMQGSSTAKYTATSTIIPPYANGSGFCTGDFNGDGNQDVMALFANSPGQACLYLGNGQGALTQAACYTLNSNTPLTCVMTDFNLDGKMDVAVGNSVPSGNSQLDLYWGDGGSALTYKSTRLIPQKGSVCKTANLNGDSYPDIMCISRGNNGAKYALMSQAGSTFALLSTVGSTITSPMVSLDLVDVNGDGAVDINIMTQIGLYSFFGSGTGNFNAPVNPPQPYTPSAAAIADMDGDGILDVLMANFNWGNFSYIIYGQGNFTFPPAPIPANAFNAYGKLADIDGDGYLDYYLQVSTGALSYALNDRAGSFGTPKTLAGAATCVTGAGDLNGDGVTDFAAIQSGSANVTILTGTGNGNFTTAQKSFPAASLCWGYGRILLTDINNDGYDDVLYSDSANVNIFLGSSSGNVVYAGMLVSPSVGTCGPLDVADINVDGYKDIVLSCQSGITIWQGLGNGQFSAPSSNTSIAVTNNTDSRFQSYIALPDLNQDGYPDVVVCSSAGALSYLNQGNGTFATTRTGLTNSGRGFGVADFNGDGLVDLLVGASVYAGDGNGNFPSSTPYQVIGINYSATGDLNNDGKADFILLNYNGIFVSHLNNGCKKY